MIKSEDIELTSGLLANKMKKHGQRREVAAYWDKYAEILGMKKENRMPKFGGSLKYHWTKQDIERLQLLLANGIEAE